MEETKKNKFGVNLLAVILAFVFGLTIGQVDFDAMLNKTSGKISRGETTQASTEAYKAEGQTNSSESLPTEEKPVIIQNVTEEKANTVYRTPTGKRYHLDLFCAGSSYIESTLEESTALGLTPCKKCAGG